MHRTQIARAEFARARPCGWRTALAACGLTSAFVLACALPGARPLEPSGAWDLFVREGSGQVFAPRIRLWQASERLETSRRRLLELDGVPLLPLDSQLGESLEQFRSRTRRELVTRTLAWVQAQSRSGYRRDARGDAWPILDELLQSGADDCDGWELLTFSTLRSFGFARGELYRAVLRRSEPEAYHMVTLWLTADAVNDPWVLDPIGSIARQPTRLSRLAAWEPLRVFDEVDQFGARRLR